MTDDALSVYCHTCDEVPNSVSLEAHPDGTIEVECRICESTETWGDT